MDGQGKRGVLLQAAVGEALASARHLIEDTTGHHPPVPKPGRERVLLRNLLTVLPTTTPTLNEAMDRVLDAELAAKTMTEAATIPRLRDPEDTAAPLEARHVAHWRGDITTLKVDAIVNAANSALLGCFQPGHKCVDNAIHSAAGPRLREACADLVAGRSGRRRKRSTPDAAASSEPAGSAQITPGFALPARHVLHTVGPVVHEGEAATEEHDRLLASCYTSCLDLAEERGLRSVAFPCVSAGLFGFPAERAAQVAAAAVRNWLETETETGTAGRRRRGVDLVLFNTFRAEDARIYNETLPRVFCGGGGGAGGHGPTALAVTTLPLPPPPPTLPPQLSAAVRRAAEVLRGASAVIIGAGAGMSATYGYPLNYLDEEAFTRQFPGFVRRGARVFYDMVGHPVVEADPQYFWGVFGPHALDIIALGRDDRASAYAPLWKLVAGPDGRQRPHFVLTSNVDALFEKNGFDPARVYAPQGDFRWTQCAAPCRPADAAWPNAFEVASALAPLTDDQENRLRSPEDVPRCPHCAGPTKLNLRAGDWFVHHPGLEEQRRAWRAFARRVVLSGEPVALLEVGAGFNTPGVVRFPLEALAAGHENVTLVRVNPGERDSRVPARVPRDRAVEIKMGAKEGLDAILAAVEAAGRVAAA